MLNLPVQVYVADDEPSIRAAYARLVRSAKMQPRTFDSVEEFMGADFYDENACVISDVRMAGTSWVELPALLARAGRRLPAILTVYDTSGTREIAQRAGAVAYFRKPADDPGRGRVGSQQAARQPASKEFQCFMNRQKFYWNYSRIFRP